MRELKIGTDLIGWTQLFLINRKVKLIINIYISLEIKLEIGFKQSILVFFILFLIYINRVLDIVATMLPNIISLLIVDYLEFLIDRKSIHETVADL